MKKHKGGYFGKILNIDVTSGDSQIQSIDDEFIETYIGGRGFAIKLLWDNLAKHGSIDPLGPKNMLVVAAGRHRDSLDRGRARTGRGRRRRRFGSST